jgi:hypothetical protein
MPKTRSIVGYGLALIPVWFLTLFILSLMAGTDQPIVFAWANIVSAIVVGTAARMFARRLHLQSPNERLVVGGVWVGIVVAIMATVAFGNATQGIIFGTWSMYLPYGAIFLSVVYSDVPHVRPRPM